MSQPPETNPMSSTPSANPEGISIMLLQGVLWSTGAKSDAFFPSIVSAFLHSIHGLFPLIFSLSHPFKI